MKRPTKGAGLLCTKSEIWESRSAGRLTIAQHFSAGMTEGERCQSVKRTAESLTQFSRPSYGL